LGRDVARQTVDIAVGEAGRLPRVYDLRATDKPLPTTPSSTGAVLNYVIFGGGDSHGVVTNWQFQGVSATLDARRGEVGRKGQIYPGQHEAIIESELWQIVQDRLAAGRHERSMAVGASGSDDTIEAMSKRLKMNKFRFTALVRLSYLSPDIIRALLAGRHPAELTPARLLRLSKDLPHDWQEQRHFLGFAA
jgi:hypothetical protein